MNNGNELYHYGVLGMKWGVRHDRKKVGSSATRHAKKDAKEYARAKMFYGEGAGTRRKLIKNTVNQRSKDPAYKEAFDKALAKQDMAKHAKKAKTERKVKDTKNKTVKTGKGIINIVTGHPERLGAGMVAAYGIYKLGQKTGVNRAIANAAKKTVKEVTNSPAVKNGMKKCADILWRLRK